MSCFSPPPFLISCLIFSFLFFFSLVFPPLIYPLFPTSIRTHPHTRTRTNIRTYIQRLLVSVDRWPADSLSPLGHYVRVLGKDGEKDVETQVINSYPSSSFSYSYSCIHHDLFASELELPFLPSSNPMQSFSVCYFKPLSILTLLNSTMYLLLPSHSISLILFFSLSFFPLVL